MTHVALGIGYTYAPSSERRLTPRELAAQGILRGARLTAQNLLTVTAFEDLVMAELEALATTVWGQGHDTGQEAERERLRGIVG